MFRLPRIAVPFSLTGLLWLAGCGGLGTYETPCYDDSACENGEVCRAGQCVLQCVTDVECPSTAPICRFNRCIVEGSTSPDASLPDAALATPDVAVVPTPDAAVAPTPDATVAPPPDAAVAPPPDAAVVATPDAAVAPTPDAAVLPDAAAATPDAAP